MSIRPTLLVLAAGMGSRYGSLKQTESFGPHGETILDYAVYDAVKAGFGKVVFVIRKSIEEEFKKQVLSKFSDKIEVDFAIQSLEFLPQGFSIPPGREKPWGTAHAVWAAASKIKEPFAVINADDFYGYRSFKIIADFLSRNNSSQEYCLVGFQLQNTLSEHGAVSRGICEIDENAYLKSVTEYTNIAQTERGIVAKEKEEEEIELRGSEIVSMNLMGFSPNVFPFFEEYFKEFLRSESPKSNKAEFYLPEVVNKLVQEGKARVKVLPSAEKWFGVTFPKDKEVVVHNLKNLLAAQVYPENLWAKESKSD